MTSKTLKPFLWIGMLLLVVSLACNIGSQPTTQPPPPTSELVVEKPIPEAVATEPETEPEPEPEEEESGAVNSLSDVKNAAIEIIAEGSFVEPEGWNINVGSRGSGFIIDPSGIAVTNNHVVTGAALLKVYIGGDTKARNARVLGVSECSDLAVIDIDGDGFPYLEWYDGEITVGTKVFAAGYPEGNYTLTDGIVSVEEAPGESYWSSVDYVVQHTAKIIPGNSGGPLVNENGQVMGVNYAGVMESDANYSISRDEALPVIKSLREGKDVDSIGVNGITVNGDIDGVAIYGIWVRSIESGSPADKARIQPGDIVYQLEGEVLATDGSMADYCDVLRSRHPTDAMNVTIIRYSDLSLMEGQLNGRELEATGYFSGSGSSDTPAAAGTYTVVDDTYTIQMDIPAAWVAVDGTVWESEWGNFTFRAPSILATTDFDLYNSYLAPGVFFAASDEMSQIGGFIELLDGLRGWYEGDCKLDRDMYHEDYGSGDWYDPWYEGKFDIWENCDGTGTNVFVLAARPKDNPYDYLMLVTVNYYTDEDLEGLFAILDTFQVVGGF